jgi:hypothetical protein
MHVNKVTVALVAKIARTAWVIITKPGALYERKDPAERLLLANLQPCRRACRAQSDRMHTPPQTCHL